MSEYSVCPIWNSTATIEPRTGHGVIVNSPRAGGRYFITDTAAEMLKTHDVNLKARLTSWLIEQRRLGVDRPKIYSTGIDPIGQRRSLSIRQRADNLLQDFPHGRGEGKERDDPVPMPSPALGHGRKTPSAHAIAGFFQFAVIFRKASQMSFVAAWSLGKCPVFRMLLRTPLCKLSIAFVVYTAARVEFAIQFGDRFSLGDWLTRCATVPLVNGPNPASASRLSRRSVGSISERTKLNLDSFS